ncbi:unnamed protein product [Staurois parvus]|uniref:Histone H2A n=1 Tax=Staurois parvus TaxID=386267 RepID=A0ABN9C5U6_9NEOB|nr:unnamed protein product [Staurois parvus]
MFGLHEQGSKACAKAKTRSSRAGLQFPESCGLCGMGPVHVYLATVLMFLTAEILELASNPALDNKKTCIMPRHLMHLSHHHGRSPA